MSNDKKWLVYLLEETNAFHSKDYDSVCLKLKLITTFRQFNIKYMNLNHFYSELKFYPSLM